MHKGVPSLPVFPGVKFEAGYLEVFLDKDKKDGVRVKKALVVRSADDIPRHAETHGDIIIQPLAATDMSVHVGVFDNPVSDPTFCFATTGTK